MKAVSVGYDISVPITITLPSAGDMELEIISLSEDPNLILNSSEILLPAFSSSSSFSFRYVGNTIPPTLSLSFSLTSQFPIQH